jgi:hypothetical protein
MVPFLLSCYSVTLNSSAIIPDLFCENTDLNLFLCKECIACPSHANVLQALNEDMESFNLPLNVSSNILPDSTSTNPVF